MFQRISSQRSVCRAKIKSIEKKKKKYEFEREVTILFFYPIPLSINFFPTLHIKHLRFVMLSHRTHFSIHKTSNLRSMSCKRFVNSSRITRWKIATAPPQLPSWRPWRVDVLCASWENFCYFLRSTQRWNSPRRKQTSLANPFVQMYPTHTYIPTQLACSLSMRVSVTINITSKVQRDRDGQAFLFFVTFLTSVYSEGQVCVYLYPSWINFYQCRCNVRRYPRVFFVRAYKRPRSI